MSGVEKKLSVVDMLNVLFAALAFVVAALSYWNTVKQQEINQQLQKESEVIRQKYDATVLDIERKKLDQSRLNNEFLARTVKLEEMVMNASVATEYSPADEVLLVYNYEKKARKLRITVEPYYQLSFYYNNGEKLDEYVRYVRLPIYIDKLAFGEEVARIDLNKLDDQLNVYFQYSKKYFDSKLAEGWAVKVAHVPVYALSIAYETRQGESIEEKKTIYMGDIYEGGSVRLISGKPDSIEGKVITPYDTYYEVNSGIYYHLDGGALQRIVHELMPPKQLHKVLLRQMHISFNRDFSDIIQKSGKRTDRDEDTNPPYMSIYKYVMEHKKYFNNKTN